ncbi:MAG TPA: DUF1311 domain-containing protein [Gammaproteobacteria bacterium]|nr:DUF1311 domain-containing protein [Gammaproteobacteria bacterium]
MCFSFAAFGKKTGSCLEKANTQSEMNHCKGISFEKADAELNRVYKLIRKVYKNDKEFLSGLKKSQLIWIKLRDADMEMRFPSESEQYQYGSAFPMCHSVIEKTLTLQRIEYLKQWLEGIEEGDVCSRSIKQPYQIREAFGKI